MSVCPHEGHSLVTYRQIIVYLVLLGFGLLIGAHGNVGRVARTNFFEVTFRVGGVELLKVNISEIEAPPLLLGVWHIIDGLPKER